MSVSRRRFLQAGAGLGAGTMLYGSWLQRMQVEAAGGATKRFIFYTTGNGVGTSIFDSEVRSPTDFDLPPVCAPLERYKSEVTVVKALACPYGDDLHGKGYYSTTMQPSGEDFQPGGPSIDRYIAQEIGSSDAFSSIALAYLYKQASRLIAYCMSADARDQPFPGEWDPVAAYQRIFATIGGSADDQLAARRALERQQSVLDFVAQDSAAMQRQLGGYERQKLEQFEGSLRELEQQLEMLKDSGSMSQACAPFQVPGDYSQTSQAITEIHDDLVTAYVDITINAMLCGLTRVAHISIGGGHSGHTKYRFLGDTNGPHKLWHSSNDPGSLPMLTQIFASDFERIAYMWDRLKAVPEGNGTMADNTVIVWHNTGGLGHHRGFQKNGHSIVVLGSAGGALRTGQYLEIDKDDHTLSDVYVAIAQAMGVQTNVFGNPASCKGPLPGMLV